MEQLTPKARGTRARIREAALRLFRERGFEATTLRDVAAAAGVSPGLAYRYFPSKEAFVLDLYLELSGELAAAAATLPAGSWTTRALAALDASFAVLTPHRPTLVALLPWMTRTGDVWGPLEASSENVRQTYLVAVTGARSPPADAVWLGRTLWLAQLAVLLFWILDRSEGQLATSRLRAWARRALPAAALLLRVPGTRRILASLADIVEHGILGRRP